MRTDDQRKDHIDPKGPKQRNCPKQLHIHNLPTNDVENINSTNKGRDLQHANKPQIVSRGKERMPQRIQRHCRVIYIDQHILNESKTRQKNLTIAWINYKKAYDMVPQSWIINCFKMYKIPDEDKLYGENHKNQENGIDSRRKKLSWSKDQKMYISRIYTISVTIHSCNDAT